MIVIPERFIWANRVILPQPNDVILEIGCGTGILLEQMGQHISKGKLIAVESSKAQLEKAAVRNASLIQEGKISLIKNEFLKQDFGSQRFDKIVAFNVPFFWKSCAKELELIGHLLKPEGTLYIFCQMPYEIELSAADPLIEKLQNHKFELEKKILKELKPTVAFCLELNRK